MINEDVYIRNIVRIPTLVDMNFKVVMTFGVIMYIIIKALVKSKNQDHIFTGDSTTIISWLITFESKAMFINK